MSLKLFLIISLLRIKNIYGIDNTKFQFLPLEENKDTKGMFMKYNKNGTRTDKTVEETTREFHKKFR
jgi:hypothetical protein